MKKYIFAFVLICVSIAMPCEAQKFSRVMCVTPSGSKSTMNVHNEFFFDGSYVAIEENSKCGSFCRFYHFNQILNDVGELDDVCKTTHYKHAYEIEYQLLPEKENDPVTLTYRMRMKGKRMIEYWWLTFKDGSKIVYLQ